MNILIRRRFGSQEGFTLVEVLVALTIFMIVTIGVMPLFISAIRGGAVSRTYTVGKNVVVQAGERVRGLPYFVDYPTQKSYGGPPYRKVDVLDLYFPDLNSASPTGYQATIPSFMDESTTNTYVTVCAASNDADPACPRSIPDGYRLTYLAQFVRVQKNASGEEEYEVLDTDVTNPGYRWDSDTRLDEPPSHLLRLTIIGSWTYQGRERMFKVATILGDREYGKLVVNGYGRVDYGVQITTGYVDPTGASTSLTATGGIADSNVQTKTTSRAQQTVRAALVELKDPTRENPVVESIEGATVGLHAAPDIPSMLPENAVAAVLTHPALGQPVAGIDGTSAENLKVQVAGELPTSQGTYNFSAPSGNERLMWVTNFEGTSGDPTKDMRLDTSNGLVSFQPGSGQTITGTTTALTKATTDADRSVRTTSTTSVGRLRLFPIEIGAANDENGNATNDRALIIIEDFTATVDCKSRPTSGAYSTYSWSATLKYLRDDAPGDGNRKGKYEKITLSSAQTSDPFASLRSANPMVYDGGGGPELNRYLFDDPSSNKKGYLTSLTSAYTGSGRLSAGVDPSSGARSASIDSAISLVSAAVDPDVPESTFAVNLGKLSCEALDQR